MNYINWQEHELDLIDLVLDLAEDLYVNGTKEVTFDLARAGEMLAAMLPNLLPEGFDFDKRRQEVVCQGVKDRFRQRLTAYRTLQASADPE